MKNFILLLTALFALVITSCNSSPSSSGPAPVDEFSDAVVGLYQDFSPDPAPSDIYSLAFQIQAFAVVFDIYSADILSVIDEIITDENIRSLLLLVIVDGYDINQLSSEMLGIFIDPDGEIAVGLPLDDEIPDGSPVTVSGEPEIVEGIDGNGMAFDEQGEYLLVPDDEGNSLVGEGGAIEVWIYPYCNITGAGIIHKGVLGDWSDESYSLQYNMPGELTLILTNEDGVNTYVISTGDLLEIENWYHVVATWDQETVWIYVNTVAMGLKYYQNGWYTDLSLPQNFAPIRDSDGGIVIGSQLPDAFPEYCFNGIIDHVMLYEHTFTAEEVVENYNSI